MAFDRPRLRFTVLVVLTLTACNGAVVAGEDVPIVDAREDISEIGIADAPDSAIVTDALDAVPDEPLTCPAGTLLCGTSCVDTSTDPRNCGACDSDCTLLTGVDPAAATCTAGVCDLDHACMPGLAHCSTNPALGCETPIDTLTDCGSCGNTCAVPANGVATCIAAMCGIRCDGGYVESAGACVAVPRPIAPLSTASVSSHRPTLRWTLPAGLDGAHVELCADRACTTSIATFDVDGDSGAPSADLSPGVVYWHLAGRVAGATTTPFGPVWQFHVGPRSAMHDGSFGTRFDANGDGYRDVLVDASVVGMFEGRVHYFAGSPTGLPTTATVSWRGAMLEELGVYLASAGDVNGDGFCDAVIGNAASAPTPQRAYLHFGSATGIDPTPSQILAAPVIAPMGFIGPVASAGDMNGDGYGDLLTSGQGSVYVFFGSARGVGAAPSLTLVSPEGTAGGFGTVLTGIGDVNGDGFDDIAIGAPGEAMNTGHVYVIHGAATSVGPTVVLSGTLNNGGFGRALAGGTDVNGDGYPDLVVGTRPNDIFVVPVTDVFYGSATGLGTVPTMIRGPVGTETEWSASVTSPGDVNGDGFADVVVGDVAASMFSGRVFVYLGSAMGVSYNPAVTIDAPAGMGTAFGSAFGGAGDIDRDGFDDLVVGANGVNNFTGEVYVFRGRATGLTRMPDTTLIGPDYNGNFGGSLY